MRYETEMEGDRMEAETHSRIIRIGYFRYMSDKYTAKEPDSAYYVGITVTDWIDFFTRKTYKDLVLESLRFCQKEFRLEIYAWCLMSSHMHTLCSSQSEKILFEVIQ